ncbi:MAG: hypothetical protein IKN24_06415 [Lachnospiraceae bacterium]|nr:hypothetical protein [Lachnospiraceae bacterium]
MAENKDKNKDSRSRFLPYQEHFHLHFSAVIFLIVLIYIVIVVINYLTKDKTGVYEVVRGDNNAATSYTAFIMREENVYNSPYNGYVNYYITPGARIRKNSTIATLDESGSFLKQIITSSSSGTGLSSSTLKRFKNAFNDLTEDFDLNDYASLYAAKNNINSELLNILAAEGMSDYFASSEEYSFDIIKTPVSGIFASTFDGYEDFDLDKLSPGVLDQSGYTRTERFSGDELKAGEFMYKIVPNDSFSIIFTMSEDDLIRYWESKKIKVYFPSIDKEITGDFSFVFDVSGNRYCKVDFSQYGFNLANTRYAQIMLRDNEVKGLEIPVSSIVAKDYYILPKAYVTKGGNDYGQRSGVMLQTYSEGQLIVSFKPVNIVEEYNDYYLVDVTDFTEGDSILKAESTDVYLIGAKKQLAGVYSVNKGYAVFKPVNVLFTLEEGYCIVEEGLKSSISLYDHIALNADMISEGEIIY